MNPIRLFAMLRTEWPRVFPLLRDARVPMWSKVLAGLAAALVLSPLDVFGDIPLIGILDDAALIVLVVHLFVAFAERTTRGAREAVAIKRVQPL